MRLAASPEEKEGEGGYESRSEEHDGFPGWQGAGNGTAVGTEDD